MESNLEKKRILSIDILRGLVMVVMALDHVRDFFHNNAMLQDPMNLETTTPILYFTRWITHYCAPIFVFLSGVSAYLSGLKKSGKELSIHLIKRGFFLILVEFTLVTFGWTFNPFYNILVFQVIWAIGFSLIILGLVSNLPRIWIIVIALTIVCFHNLLDYLEAGKFGTFGIIWDALHAGRFSFYPLFKNHGLLIVYPALPWTGIMLLGYCIGKWYQNGFEVKKRKNYLWIMAISMIILFILIRFNNGYGDPGIWKKQSELVKNIMAFLDVRKYPPSLMFTCMTIGPACIFLALSENAKGFLARIMTVYGKVPFFYYLLHIYVIHAACVILFFASGYGVDDIVSKKAMFNFRPPELGFDLGGVYLVWLLIVAGLYFPCKWYYKFRAQRKHWIYSYI